jgi:hypothetical protein
MAIGFPARAASRVRLLTMGTHMKASGTMPMTWNPSTMRVRTQDAAHENRQIVKPCHTWRVPSMAMAVTSDTSARQPILPFMIHV